MLDSHSGILAAFSACEHSSDEKRCVHSCDRSFMCHSEQSWDITRSSHYGNMGEANRSEPNRLTIHEYNNHEQGLVRRKTTQTLNELDIDGSVLPGFDMLLLAQYERIEPEFRSPRSGKPIQGILVVLSNCRSGVREEDFNDWYNSIHIPELLGTGFYHTANRYRLVVSEPDAPRYATIYETEQEATSAANALLAYRGKWTQHATHGMVYEVGLRGVFQAIR